MLRYIEYISLLSHFLCGFKEREKRDIIDEVLVKKQKTAYSKTWNDLQRFALPDQGVLKRLVMS